MAKVSAFGFSNVTPSPTDSIVPIQLGLATNYAVTSETANEAKLSNKTSPVDVEELFTFKSQNIPVVNTELNIQYPSPVKKGVQYMVMSEATLSTTDTADPSFRVDEPIVIYTWVRHPKSGNITPALLAQAFTRHCSGFKRQDGTWRFDDFMRMAERPIVD